MATHSSVLAWKNPMNRGGWQATFHGVAKNQTQLSNYTSTRKNTEKESAKKQAYPDFCVKWWRRKNSPENPRDKAAHTNLQSEFMLLMWSKNLKLMI